MKNYILPIFTVGLLLSGCSAAYKTGQTPDDVYYSKPKQSAEIVQQQQSKPTEEYQSYFAGEDDEYLRMKVRNGGKWNSIDDYDYWYGYNSYNPYMNPYLSGITFSYNNYWGMNSYNYGTGGYYSPFISSIWYTPSYYHRYYSYYPVVINKRPTYSSQGFRPSLNGYNNPNFDRGNSRYSPAKPTYRNIFSNGNNNGNSGYDRPARTYNSESSSPSRSYSPSSSGSSSGSSNSGSRSSSGGSSSSGGRGGRGG